MNNKGFTLIELLATILVLALVVGVTVVSVNTFFNKSKDNAEKVFVEELSSIIEDYITLNSMSFVVTGECVEDNCKNHISEMQKKDVNYNIYVKENAFTLNDIVGAELINEKDLVNPKTKQVCSPSSNITIYRDTNYVYCFKVNLDCYSEEITNCDFELKY